MYRGLLPREYATPRLGLWTRSSWAMGPSAGARADWQPLEGLELWIGRAQSCGLPEMGAFVTKMRQDVDVVVAGLASTHSQGQMEGNVNGLKLLKGQMYGRAGFETLHRRFLTTGAATGRTRIATHLVFGRPPPPRRVPGRPRGRGAYHYIR